MSENNNNITNINNDNNNNNNNNNEDNNKRLLPIPLSKHVSNNYIDSNDGSNTLRYKVEDEVFQLSMKGLSIPAIANRIRMSCKDFEECLRWGRYFSERSIEDDLSREYRQSELSTYGSEYKFNEDGSRKYREYYDDTTNEYIKKKVDVPGTGLSIRRDMLRDLYIAIFLSYRNGRSMLEEKVLSSYHDLAWNKNDRVVLDRLYNIAMKDNNIKDNLEVTRERARIHHSERLAANGSNIVGTGIGNNNNNNKDYNLGDSADSGLFSVDGIPIDISDIELSDDEYEKIRREYGNRY